MADKRDKGGGKPEEVGVDVGKVIRIDEQRIKSHLGEIVRDTVEETLNGLLDAEADDLCGAKRYEHDENRKDTRAGHYTRKLGFPGTQYLIQRKTGIIEGGN
ncbi:MAG TPA: transposase [Acidobacteriota bacterium]|nr:transposase [Acidobacteriota bacterium]